MRKVNSLKNALAAILSNIVSIIMGLVSQAYFIKILGEEYLGLNSLFTNILSMLAIVELGIGSAIIYNLYKPIAEDDKETIKSLMKFYKKSYHIIAMIVLIIGISIMPFLKYVIGEVKVNINLNAIYILFLLDTVASYFLSYKRSILYANQKNYLINIVHIGYTIILNISQMLILYFTRSYYLYLCIKLFARIAENLVITYISNKMYVFLNDRKTKNLDKKIEEDIFKKVKALFFHKIGIFVINGTDNIIISAFLGVSTVGYYSNYYLIINAVQTVFSQIISATTASIGNLLVVADKDKQFDIFNKIKFLNLYISIFANVCIFNIMDSFITIWIGEKFVLSKVVLFTLVLNNFQKLQRTTYGAFKDAGGVFYEDRFVPIIESLINIISSILFVNIFGLSGVFIGTITSSLILWFYSYPKFVYKKLLGKDYKKYTMEIIKDISSFIVILLISYLPIPFIHIGNTYMKFIMNTIISLILPNVLLIFIYRKNKDLQYYINLIKKIFIKRKEENNE